MAINNYWTRLSKISRILSGELINYLPKPKAEANQLIGETLTNHDILRQPSSIIVLSFDHRVCFHIFFTSWQLREAICHFFSRERDSNYAGAEYYLQQNTFRQ